MKYVQGNFERLKKMDSDESELYYKKRNFTSSRTSLQPKNAMHSKHHILLSCFFLGIQKEEFQEKKKVKALFTSQTILKTLGTFFCYADLPTGK